MSARVSLAVSDDGQLLAVKRSLDPADAARLAAEAEIIQAISHPDLVTLHDVQAAQAGFELRTVWVGTRSAADLAHIEPRRAGAICAAVADTLAELHERGIVHGRVEASHVLLGATPSHLERPVLCSLGSAGPAGEPAPESDEPRRPSGDVAGLGRLLTELLALPAPIGTPRWGAEARRRTRERATLARLATRATASDPAGRPGARAMAGALRAALDEGPEPTNTTPASEGHPMTQQGGREAIDRARHGTALSGRRAVAAGALGIVSVVAAAGAVGVLGEQGPATPATAPSPPAPSERHEPASHDEMHRAPVVTVEGRVYEVGEPGDQATVAGWRCDGKPSVAVLRPATGAVFLFDVPLPQSDSRTISPVARVEPGSRLVGPSASEACPELEVTTPSGRTTTVEVRREVATP